MKIIERKGETTFETGDIWLSAFLSACGLHHQLQSKNGRIIFIFPSGPDTDKLIVNFNNNVSIPALDFVNACKTVKGQMQNLKYSNSNRLGA